MSASVKTTSCCRSLKTISLPGKVKQSDLLTSPGANLPNRVLPTVNGLITRQTRTEAVLQRTVNEFRGDLDDIRNMVIWGAQQGWEQLGQLHIRQCVTEAMQQLDTKITQAQRSCVDMATRFDEFSADIHSALSEASSTRETQVSEQLKAKDSIIVERETRIQLLAEDYRARVASLADQINDRAKSADEGIRTTLAHITSCVNSLLERDNEAPGEKLRESEEVNLDLQNQLSEIKTRLLETQAAFDSGVQERNQQLDEERLTASNLTARIQELEEEAVTMTSLRETWQKDIDSIQTLRAKVATACQRLPRVESMAAKLDNISRLNGFIHSTARYMSSEKDWIQRELATRGKDAAEEAGVYMEPSKVTSSIGSLQSHSQTACGIAREPHESRAASRLDTLFAEDFAPRKVEVRSPEDFDSPSPPPTVEQEQIRRREVSRPRSIMRVALGAEHVTLPPRVNIATVDSQSGQPTALRTTNGNGDELTEKIHEEIRAGLIPPERRSAWKLPTVTEFQKTFNEARPQRLETDSLQSSAGQVSPGDLQTIAGSIPVPRGVTPRRLVTRTYTQQYDT